ncbi:terminase large subunit [Streptomyces filamentosus]|uniref:Terminase n=1 Tax=Streptomyces filamentosus TaxID=67294 RepID=A0A919BBB4_STRFL|nr:terminase TerL endonuclease subunit [Streptomyces filamentosus]GHF77005.1 terminase [Streptomyces filamentosus]
MATRTTTPSVDLPDSDELERLKLSPEVAWYLLSRGVPLPDCPPLIQTPSPGEAPGAVFDPDRVDKVIKAFSLLRHTQGQWAGQPLRPDPWQVAYILAPVFGWVRWDADAGAYVRIVRELYVDVPRKNGKSTLAGGLAIYMTCADGEQGAQCITAATTKEQAGFVFEPVKKLAEAAPALKRHVTPLKGVILHRKSGSYFKPISSVAGAQHGANIHCAIIDELHEHKTPELVETIETGTGSRRQPLVVIITTADSGKRESVYDRKRQRVEKLARRVFEAPSVYGVVWAAERDDDPHVEATWRKANPGYGVSPTRAYLQSKSDEAKQSPADLAKFLRLHLGRRTKQETKFLTMESWHRNAGMVDEARLAGREAYGGLDLAATSDLLALCWLFPDDERDGFDAIWRLWTPEDNVDALDQRTAGAATVWVREGLLVATPGNVADYDYIQLQIERDMEVFDVRSIGFDPWSAVPLTNKLAESDAPMVKVRQGFITMSPPLKEMQRLLLKGTPEAPMFRHGGNPAVTWMVDNLAVAMDPAGNVKPDKARSAEKIDAVSAAVTALSEAMTREPVVKSAYEDGDLEVV